MGWGGARLRLATRSTHYSRPSGKETANFRASMLGAGPTFPDSELRLPHPCRSRFWSDRVGILLGKCPRNRDVINTSAVSISLHSVVTSAESCWTLQPCGYEGRVEVECQWTASRRERRAFSPWSDSPILRHRTAKGWGNLNKAIDQKGWASHHSGDPGKFLPRFELEERSSICDPSVARNFER